LGKEREGACQGTLLDRPWHGVEKIKMENTMGEKVNCWEFQKCGTEKSCPAYPIYGRLCFSVKGTLCRGEVQGDYQEKIKRCRTECKFYEKIIGEA
jgi:hypothetical protein